MTKHDGLNWHAFARVEKYDPELVRDLTQYLGYEPTAWDFKREGVGPSDIAENAGNLVVTTGLGNITNLIIGGGGQAFNAAKAIVGVGATATTATVSDTALGGNTNSSTAWYQAPAAPTRTTTTNANDTISAVTTFASGDANFSWQEWCWAAATSGSIVPGNTLASVATSPVLLNHKAPVTLGTKVTGGVWVFTTTVTLS